MEPHHLSHAPAHQDFHTDEHPTHSLNLTFISIHDLSPDARILYSSESIIDVLGYTPEEVVNRSIWDYFPPEEIPYAKMIHKSGIEWDKAAMLAYCRVKDKTDAWVGCECCFTIVYDVMVVCTSIYRSGLPSQKRAQEAPLIRRRFTSSPRDPRYHMLSHISHKFQSPAKQEPHEPRAALFLNRFTRTLTIMYATSGIEDIVGISSHSLQGRSFYYCIAENCLSDAIRCLENAKGNDSIAYLRFWFRDPRRDDASPNYPTDDSDDDMTTDTSVDQETGGGVQLGQNVSHSNDTTPGSENVVRSDGSMDLDLNEEPQSRTSSGDSMNPTETHEGIFGATAASESSASSAPRSPDDRRDGPDGSGAIELEAVISCASDGLVVCLRKARPFVPPPSHRPVQVPQRNGVFAAPWADEPVIPALDARSRYGQNTSFTPSLGPQAAQHHVYPTSPDPNDFMTAIREQAIFAWALTGINGALHRFGHGKPLGESLPASGIPLWKSDPHASEGYESVNSDDSMVDSVSSSTVTSNQPKSPTDTHASRAVGNDHRNIFGDPGIKNTRQSPNPRTQPHNHTTDGPGEKYDLSRASVDSGVQARGAKDHQVTNTRKEISADTMQLPDGL